MHEKFFVCKKPSKTIYNVIFLWYFIKNGKIRSNYGIRRYFCICGIVAIGENFDLFGICCIAIITAWAAACIALLLIFFIRMVCCTRNINLPVIKYK